MEGEEYTKREFESFRITETSFEPTSPSRNDTHRGDKYERNETLVPYNLFTEWKMDADDNDSPMNHRGFVLETGTYFASPYILRSMITDSRSLEIESEAKSSRKGEQIGSPFDRIDFWTEIQFNQPTNFSLTNERISVIHLRYLMMVRKKIRFFHTRSRVIFQFIHEGRRAKIS